MNKEEIRNKLMSIVLVELEKEYKEIDSDLITECIDFITEIDGNEKLTDEEIKNRVKSIPFK